MPTGKHAWADILNVQRWRKSGDLAQLKTKLWRTICVFEQGMNAAMERQDAEDVRKWGHGMAQLGHVYLKVTLDSDFEKRIAALEQQALEDRRSA